MILAFLSLLWASEPTAHWQVLQEQPTRVACVSPDSWCQASIVSTCSLEQLEKKILDFAGYKRIFPHTRQVKAIDKHTVYIRIDMPLLYADRDYVIRFATERKADTLVLSFTSMSSAMALQKDVIRIDDMAGSWTFHRLSKGSKVVYKWNSDYRLDVPKLMKPKVRIRQGVGVLESLRQLCASK